MLSLLSLGNNYHRIVSLFVSKKSFNLVVLNHTWNYLTWYNLTEAIFKAVLAR